MEIYIIGYIVCLFFTIPDWAELDFENQEIVKWHVKVIVVAFICSLAWPFALAVWMRKLSD